MGDERIDRHLAQLSERHRAPLMHIRALLHEVLPAGDETIKYAMPCIAVQGKGVAAFDAFKEHWSYFPMSGSVLERVTGLPDWVEADRGTLRVPLDKRLTKLIVKRLVRVRLDEISAVTNGKRFDFYDDGGVKASGSMKDGLMHGAWRWWRDDGTLMREGRFAAGEQVGVWSTWHRDGTLVKQTRF
jgi:uncharacterized protein YdhG (YjbR/CyaY superfamily)